MKLASGRRHPKTCMVMLVRNPSTQMAGLSSSFKYQERNSVVAEEMAKYALASAEVAYGYLGEQASMRFMASGGESLEARNYSHWSDQKHP